MMSSATAGNGPRLAAFNNHITVGGLILSCLGVLLLFLAISGAVIW